MWALPSSWGFQDFNSWVASSEFWIVHRTWPESEKQSATSGSNFALSPSKPLVVTTTLSQTLRSIAWELSSNPGREQFKGGRGGWSCCCTIGDHSNNNSWLEFREKPWMRESAVDGQSEIQVNKMSRRTSEQACSHARFASLSSSRAAYKMLMINQNNETLIESKRAWTKCKCGLSEIKWSKRGWWRRGLGLYSGSGSD